MSKNFQRQSCGAINYLSNDISIAFSRCGGRTSKCDNVRGSSIKIRLKTDVIAQVGWLTDGENFASKRDQFILCAFVDFLASEEIREHG